MAIMEEVNRTANTSMEGVEEAAYVGKIPTSETEVIDKLTGADPGSPAIIKMKDFLRSPRSSRRLHTYVKLK